MLHPTSITKPSLPPSELEVQNKPPKQVGDLQQVGGFQQIGYYQQVSWRLAARYFDELFKI